MFDRGFFLTLQAIRRQLAAMPHDLYLIRLIHNSTRRAFPGERLWTASQLVRWPTIRFLRRCNREGWDVYIYPYAEDRNAGYILLDLDHAIRKILDIMRAHGHEPCVMLQTSPGHFQAWIRVSTTPLEPALATAVGKQLAHAYGGDLASTEWHHLGRLAGFTNQKLERRIAGRAPWVKILHARTGLACCAQDLLCSVTPLMPPAWRATEAPADPTRRKVSRLPSITAEAAVSIYQRWIERWHILERFPQPDWSIVDLWVARKLLAQSIPVTQVETILRLGSPSFPRHHADPEDYLRRTLARATFPASPRPVCSTHAAPALRADEVASDCSNSTGGR